MPVLINDPRSQREAEHLHLLGVRALAEFLTQIDRAAGGNIMRYRLAAYQHLSPDLVRAISADRFPPAALHLVPSTEGDR